jgi:Flp pilus assembly protein TadD
MTFRNISLVLALAAALSGAAMAQKGSSANNGPGALSAADPYGSNATLREGMDAMQAGNYTLAESRLVEFLKAQPKHPRGNFMLGVAEMQLGKWPEAKTYLEMAVQTSPREPDPKGRLGITLAKLGDAAGAAKQREELGKMDKSCKGACANAKWIASNIAQLDAAIAEAKAAPAH